MFSCKFVGFKLRTPVKLSVGIISSEFCNNRRRISKNNYLYIYTDIMDVKVCMFVTKWCKNGWTDLHEIKHRNSLLTELIYRICFILQMFLFLYLDLIRISTRIKLRVTISKLDTKILFMNRSFFGENRKKSFQLIAVYQTDIFWGLRSIICNEQLYSGLRSRETKRIFNNFK